MIQVQCGGCQKRYSVPDNFAGKKMRCKQCAAVVGIPAAEGAVLASGAAAPPAKPPPSPGQELAGAGRVAAPASARKPGAPKFPSRAGAAGATGAGIPKKSFSAKGFAGKKLGAKKIPSQYSSKAASAELGAEGEAAAADAGGQAAGGSKKRLFLIAGGAVAVACLAVLAYLFFFQDGSGGGAGKRRVAGGAPAAASKTAGKNSKDQAGEKRDAGEEAASDEQAAGAETTAAETAAAEPLPPVDPLSIIPAGVNVLTSVAFGRVTNIPVVREQLEGQLKSNEDSAAIFKEAGFDPLAHLRTIWLAGLLTSVEAKPDDFQALVILEGMFEKDKVIEALKKHSLVGDAGKKVGRREVFDMKEGGQHQGYLTFASDEVLLLGRDELFNNALKLIDGGDSVRKNTALKELSKDFEPGSLGWVALDLPKKIKDEMAAKAKDAQEQGGPPVPRIDGGFLSIDTTDDGEGLKLAAVARCPDAAEVKKAQQYVAFFKLMMAQQAPPPLKPLLDALKIKPEDSSLGLTLELSGKTIQELKAMVPMLLGFPPPPAVAGEGEEAGEKTEGAESGEAKAEEGAEGGKDEEPANEPEMEKPAEEKAGAEEPAEEKAPDEKVSEEKPAEDGGAGEKVEKPSEEKPDEKPAEEEKASEKPASKSAAKKKK